MLIPIGDKQIGIMCGPATAESGEGRVDAPEQGWDMGIPRMNRKPDRAQRLEREPCQRRKSK